MYKNFGKQMQMAINHLILMTGILGGTLTVIGQQDGNKLVPGTPFTDGQTLISPGGTFQFGFFSPVGSTARYLGVSYYNIPEHNVVWIANRQTPINSKNGTLNLTLDGNLVIFDNKNIIWSTSTSNSLNPVLQLLDSGNLVLTGGSFNTVLWQSFDYPCDTFLPGMKIGVDYRNNLSRSLTSWMSASNPSPGDYSWKMEVLGVPEMFMFHVATKVFRTGPWKGLGWSGRPDRGNNNVFIFDFVSNQYEIYYSFKTTNSSLISRAVMNGTVLVRYLWSDSRNAWNIFWTVPEDPCDAYGYCGNNGVCTATYSHTCECLPGFIPKSNSNWNVLRQYQDGCVRKTPLNCTTDKFRIFQNVKLPDTLNASVDSDKTLEQCRDWCFENCSCMAYAVLEATGCLTWPGDLFDIRSFTIGADELYIRLAASEFGNCPC